MTCCRKRRGDERTNEPTNQRAQEQTGVNKSTFVYVDITYFAHWGFSPWPSAIRAAFLVLPSAIRAVFLVLPAAIPRAVVACCAQFLLRKQIPDDRPVGCICERLPCRAAPVGFFRWGSWGREACTKFLYTLYFWGREERTSTVFWPGSRGRDSSPAIGVNWGVPGSGV